MSWRYFLTVLSIDQSFGLVKFFSGSRMPFRLYSFFYKNSILISI